MNEALTQRAPGGNDPTGETIRYHRSVIQDSFAP